MKPTNILSNHTYDELTIDQTAAYSRTLTEDAVILFAAASGDTNPIHLDDTFAATTSFKQRIGHGMWTGSIISAALALVLPGPGCTYLKQTLAFHAPVFIGDTITVHLKIVDKHHQRKTVQIDCKVINQHSKTVAKGQAEIMPATRKISIPQPKLPAIKIEE